jgi:hypothetical protein
MRQPAWSLAVALVMASATLVTGCGSTAPSTGGPPGEAPPGGAPALATSLTTGAGTWAIAVMGGSVASHNNFWQLFVRPADSTQWKLVTPPGVPDNGGLVVADAGGQSLITGFRPSQYLTYTPLTATRNGGQAWSTPGPLDAAVANVPDALAVAPNSGQLLALLTSGAAKLAAAPGYTRWSVLTTQRAIAATPPGRRCGLRGLTAAAFTPSGMPLLGGTCSRLGTAGIFADRNGTWRSVGPHLPATLARQAINVVRLTRVANRITALLKAGNGPAASLLAAWSADNGSHWALSPPLPLNSAKLSSASFGPAGGAAIVLSGNRAQAIMGPGAAWRLLPALPSGTATLALGSDGGFDALAVHGSRLTVWQLSSRATTWRTSQAMFVPIQYGSSG